MGKTKPKTMTCPICEGSGFVSVGDYCGDDDYDWMEWPAECDRCEGAGKVDKDGGAIERRN